MIIDRQDNITLITQEKASIPDMVSKMEEAYDTFKSDNVIVNLTVLETITLQHMLEFLRISNKHRKAKHSFVIVNNSVDVDKTPDELVIVPTLQEAYDIIEMEEMERDLGF